MAHDRDQHTHSSQGTSKYAQKYPALLELRAAMRANDTEATSRKMHLANYWLWKYWAVVQ